MVLCKETITQEIEKNKSLKSISRKKYQELRYYYLKEINNVDLENNKGYEFIEAMKLELRENLEMLLQDIEIYNMWLLNILLQETI